MNRNPPPRFHVVPIQFLDWDDLGPTLNEGGATVFDAVPYALSDSPAPQNDVPRNDVTPAEGTPSSSERRSYVRMRSFVQEEADEGARHRAEGARFLDAMEERQLNLTVSLLCLQHASQDVPYDLSGRAAAEALGARIQEASDLHEILGDIYIDLAGLLAHNASLLAADAVIPAFVNGLYMWCEAVVATLTDLAAKLRILQPDWAALRRSLTDAATWYFDGLPAEIRAAVSRATPRPAARLGERLEELFWASSWLNLGLEKRFG